MCFVQEFRLKYERISDWNGNQGSNLSLYWWSVTFTVLVTINQLDDSWFYSMLTLIYLMHHTKYMPIGPSLTHIDHTYKFG